MVRAKIVVAGACGLPERPIIVGPVTELKSTENGDTEKNLTQREIARILAIPQPEVSPS
jgi:hypothetical protein